MKLYQDDMDRRTLHQQKCFICGRNQRTYGDKYGAISLLFHHILPKTEYKESYLGIILCRSCHHHIHWFHRNYDKVELIYKQYKILLMKAELLEKSKKEDNTEKRAWNVSAMSQHFDEKPLIKGEKA